VGHSAARAGAKVRRDGCPDGLARAEEALGPLQSGVCPWRSGEWDASGAAHRAEAEDVGRVRLGAGAEK